VNPGPTPGRGVRRGSKRERAVGRPPLPIIAAARIIFPPFARPQQTRAGSVTLELPTKRRIPLTWLVEHGGDAIRYRTLTELAPAGHPLAAPDAVARAHEAALEAKPALAVAKRQKEGGVWGANLLGLAADADAGIREPGTIAQYRRLLQLGWPADARALRTTDRLLFRILSRDEDPALLLEWQKPSRNEPVMGAWARDVFREAATAALAESGHGEDPRVRGAAHKIASAVSQFLRSPLADDPFVKAGRATALHAEAHPPSWYSVAMIAAMPSLRRERAGFTERLGRYLAQPAPKKGYLLVVGDATVKPQHLLLGDPIDTDAKGCPKDIPLALHFIELVARMGALGWATGAAAALARLLHDCDEHGVWHPRNLKAPPKALDPVTHHYYPLQPDEKHAASWSADVTFRLAVIAKVLGWEVEYD
jgi:hypothetical protein